MTPDWQQLCRVRGLVGRLYGWLYGRGVWAVPGEGALYRAAWFDAESGRDIERVARLDDLERELSAEVARINAEHAEATAAAGLADDAEYRALVREAACEGEPWALDEWRALEESAAAFSPQDRRSRPD